MKHNLNQIYHEKAIKTSILHYNLVCILQYNSFRQSHKLTRSAIGPPVQSAWSELVNYGDNALFLDLTGFSRSAFIRLEHNLFDNEPFQSFGRPRMLDPRSRLDLLLFFVNS